MKGRKELPKRTADTMSEAIAISSPNGRVSKRAKEEAVKRLHKVLFGEGGLQPEPVAQPSERERLLAQIAHLRNLAARGMSTKKFTKEADRLEALISPPKSNIY
jgi:hypothetical protein